MGKKQVGAATSWSWFLGSQRILKHLQQPMSPVQL
jgi:hypothetical protein